MYLEIQDLRVAFGAYEAVHGVSLGVDRGEILGVVGESGSGKSLTAMSAMGLLPLLGGRMATGRILLDGADVTTLDQRAWSRLRGRKLALITQNPMTSLDPMVPVGGQTAQSAALHLGMTRRQAWARAVDLMDKTGIPDPARVAHDYPHQLSGGMRQRIVIAMALAAEPALLIADEPTTALDVTVQAQIIDLLVDLVRGGGLGLMLITHDMGLVAQTCDRVAVMREGEVVETAPTRQLFAAPAHSYSAALIAAVPRMGVPLESLRAVEPEVGA